MISTQKSLLEFYTEEAVGVLPRRACRSSTQKSVGFLPRRACRSSTQNSELPFTFNTIFYSNTLCVDCNYDVTQAVLKLTVATKHCHDIAYVSCHTRKETEFSFLLFLKFRM
jgi:hypothetical protein